MNRKYVDHPAPGIGVMAIMTLGVGGLFAGIVAAFQATPSEDLSFWPIAVVGAALVSWCFYFWPLYSTYYTLSAEGLLVRYGPWSRQYPWSDFSAAYWQKDVFSTRIGWPSITPCVRLTNAVLLKRRSKRFGLYLTPNDPRAFLRRVGEFDPDLTRETIF